MSTTLRWKSLDLMYVMFHRTLWKFPFRWDRSQRKYLSSFSKKDWIIFFVFETFLILFQGVLVPAFVLIRQIVFPVAYVTTYKVLCCLCTCIIAAFSCLISLSIIGRKDETAYVFNQLATLDDFFEEELKMPNYSPTVDVIGIFMNGLALSFASLSILMPIFSAIDVDPFYHVQKFVIETTNVSPVGLTLLCFRGFCAAVGFLGGVRVFLTVFLNFILGLKIIIYCITMLLKAAISVDNAEILKRHHSLYCRLQVIISILHGLVSPATIGIMSLGLLVAITFNFATLRMYGIIPMPIFLFYPVVAVIVPCLAHTLLPEGTMAYEGTRSITQKWSYTVRCSKSTKNSKYILKKIKSIKPSGFYGGIGGFNFYLLQNSTKSTYYWIMIEYTIDCLLSIPQSVVDSAFTEFRQHHL